MSAFTQALTAVSAVGTATVAGVFFAYSTFTMSGLKQLPSQQGVAAMQAINREAPKAPLMLLLFGTALTCTALLVASLLHLGAPGALVRVVACVLYLVGAVLVTGTYHVPRNNLLDAVDPQSAEGALYWATYLREWVRMNHVRTAAPLVAAALLVGSLRGG